METYLFYVLIMTVSVLFLWASSRVERGNLRSSLIFGSFVALYIPLVIRDITVGVDYVRYRDTFYDVISSSVLNDSIVSWLGWPFIYLMKILAPLVFNNYIIFYGLVSLVGFAFLYKAILKAKISWLALFLFVAFCLYFQMFNQIRQMTSICIILSSIEYIKNKSILKFVLTVAFASVFHMTSVLFLPMYILAQVKLSKKTVLIYIIVGAIVFASSAAILSLVANTSYGVIYLESGYNIALLLSTLQNFVVRLVMLVGCLLFAKRTMKVDSRLSILFTVAIYCTLIQVLAINSALFGRVTTMFFVVYVLLVPAIVSACYRGWSRQKVIIGIILISLIYQYVYYVAPSGAKSAGYDRYSVTGRSIMQK